jgi:hypothetical protein
MAPEQQPPRLTTPLGNQVPPKSVSRDSVGGLDSTNPYEPPQMASDPFSVTESLFASPMGTRAVANMIAILVPPPMTAIGFLLIAVASECNTFECRRAHTVIGAFCGIVTIFPQVLVANIVPTAFRIKSTAISVAVVALLVLFAYFRLST